MEDRQIIRLLFQRAETALEALAQTFGSRLLSLSKNILADERDAQECVNDTYLAVWNTIPPQKPDPLWAYVCRVGKNICYNRLRSNRAQKRGGEYDLSLEELAEALSLEDPESKVEAKALGKAINLFLWSQSKENRVIFLRRHWFGDSVQDIAGSMGLSESAVSVRLSRIRGKLRDYLVKEDWFHG